MGVSREEVDGGNTLQARVHYLVVKYKKKLLCLLCGSVLGVAVLATLCGVTKHRTEPGGYNIGYQSSCYLLVERVWTPVHTMMYARYTAAISLTTRGLLVSGGHTGSGLTNTTELFSSGSWVPGPSLPIALWAHCQVTSGEVTIVAGGTPWNTRGP